MFTQNSELITDHNHLKTEHNVKVVAFAALRNDSIYLQEASLWKFRDLPYKTDNEVE